MITVDLFNESNEFVMELIIIQFKTDYEKIFPFYYLFCDKLVFL